MMANIEKMKKLNQLVNEEDNSEQDEEETSQDAD